jgi:hypothetical protein
MIIADAETERAKSRAKQWRFMGIPSVLRLCPIGIHESRTTLRVIFHTAFDWRDMTI